MKGWTAKTIPMKSTPLICEHFLNKNRLVYIWKIYKVQPEHLILFRTSNGHINVLITDDDYCSYNSKMGTKSIKSVPRRMTTKNYQKKFERFIWRFERWWIKPTVMPRKRAFLDNQIKVIRFLIIPKSGPDFIKWTFMKYSIFWL